MWLDCIANKFVQVVVFWLMHPFWQKSIRISMIRSPILLSTQWTIKKISNRIKKVLALIIKKILWIIMKTMKLQNTLANFRDSKLFYYEYCFCSLISIIFVRAESTEFSSKMLRLQFIVSHLPSLSEIFF